MCEVGVDGFVSMAEFKVNVYSSRFIAFYLLTGH